MQNPCGEAALLLSQSEQSEFFEVHGVPQGSRTRSLSPQQGKDSRAEGDSESTSKRNEVAMKIEEYNLIYRHKKTGEEIKAKRLVHWSYRALVDGKSVPMTKTELHKDYDPDPKNRGVSLRAIGKRSRVPKRLSREFQAYLKGEMV
jgi:hypothetical protein